MATQPGCAIIADVLFAKGNPMKRILLSTALILGTASMSLAGGWGGKDSARSDRQHQNQGQNQGQSQGQNQGQGQIANVSNAPVYNEAVTAPSMSVANACGVGFSFGSSGTMSGVYVPVSAGVTFESRTCVILREAVFFAEMGRRDLALAHMTHIKRVKKTVQATQGN